jgi:hypothetical protein
MSYILPLDGYIGRAMAWGATLRKTTIIGGLICFSTLACFASSITSSTNTIGTSYTAVIGGSSVAFSDLTNAVISVTFSDASFGSCVFASQSSSVFGCGTASFDIVLSPKNSQSNSHSWQIDNLKAAGTSITSLSIDVLQSTAVKVGFDSATVTTAAGGSAISAAAELTNALHTSVQTPAQATEFGLLILSFSGTQFDGGTNFTFNASNHFITSAISDVPEPATLGMVGLALAGLGALRFRKRKI